MNVLFVCKYNVFRSQVAEAYLRKINKKVNVESAGVVKETRIFRNVIRVSRSLGLNLRGEPRGLNAKLVKWADIIVIVADDVPKDIFTRKKVLVWKIEDVDEKDKNMVRERTKIIKKIMKKVDKLNKQLEKGKWKQ
jgi:protein-tyrosine-phosphatase